MNSMKGWGIGLGLFVLLTITSAFINPIISVVFVIITLVYVLTSLQIIYQYQRGVVFTLGRYSGLLNPGLNVIIANNNKRKNQSGSN